MRANEALTQLVGLCQDKDSIRNLQKFYKLEYISEKTHKIIFKRMELGLPWWPNGQESALNAGEVGSRVKGLRSHMPWDN